MEGSFPVQIELADAEAIAEALETAGKAWLKTVEAWSRNPVEVSWDPDAKWQEGITLQSTALQVRVLARRAIAAARAAEQAVEQPAPRPDRVIPSCVVHPDRTAGVRRGDGSPICGECAAEDWATASGPLRPLFDDPAGGES